MAYDPVIAIGYEYELTDAAEGSAFADIRLPTVGDDNEYEIAIFDSRTGEYMDPVALKAGETFDHTAFDFPVTKFSILGIDTSEMVDPDNGRAFPALIGFVGEGSGTLRQTPLVVDIANGCVVPDGVIPGDLNSDGEVAFTDFLVFSANFGATDVGYAQGDINCDGEVAFTDFLVFSANFGQTSATTASVPEPSAGMLALLCRLAFVRRRKA